MEKISAVRQSFGSGVRDHYTTYTTMAAAKSPYTLEAALPLNQTVMQTANISNNNNVTLLPTDMTFGAAQIISISAYTPLFLTSAFLNLRVLRKLWHTKHSNGLSRLNQLLMHLVLADLSVSYHILN